MYAWWASGYYVTHAEMIYWDSNKRNSPLGINNRNFNIKYMYMYVCDHIWCVFKRYVFVIKTYDILSKTSNSKHHTSQ